MIFSLKNLSALKVAAVAPLCLLLLVACGEAKKHSRLCETHFNTDSFKIAQKHCQKAADDGDSASQYFLGMIYLRQGQRQEGRELIERSAEAGFQKAIFHSTVWTFLSKDVDYATAKKAIQQMQEYAEAGDDVAQFWMGNVFLFGYMEQKRSPNEATYWYQLSVEQGNHRSMNNLAWIKALARDSDLFDPNGAIALAKKAVKKHPKSHGYLDTLAAAYAANNDFNAAITTQEQALSLAQSDDCEHCSEHLIKYYQEHLDRYRQQKPLEDDLFK